VLLSGVLISIERNAHGTVTNCMREDLKPAAIEFSDCLSVLFGRPLRGAGIPRRIEVGCQQGCGVILNHTIQKKLCSSDGEPCVVIFGAGLFEGGYICGCEFGGLNDFGNVEPD